ncbi:MAG: MlaC/ttg2D family ABC transporter substrate-binding protein, partial [Burkholderiales bacterium]
MRAVGNPSLIVAFGENMKALSFALLFVVGLTTNPALGARELSPDELVRKTTDEVLEIVKNDPDYQKGNREKALALAQTKIVPHFDFTRMTRLAVGKHWRQASSAQQNVLVEQFRTLLV